jgi:antitoxin component YwqK of YwqJK toxin-antitoxin module
MSYADLKLLPDFEYVCIFVNKDSAKIIFSYLLEIIKKKSSFSTCFSETPLVNGKRHGKMIFYYEPNVILSETQYINDIENGLYLEYHRNGLISYEMVFVNGVTNGTKREYDKNGYLVEEYQLVNGKKNGFHKKYKSGSIKQIEFYRDGKLIKN